METVVEVVPLIRLPRRLGAFDYLTASPSAPQLQPGQLVTVLFRQRLVTAVVWKTQTAARDRHRRYQTIGAVVSPRPLLTQVQMALAEWISGTYLQSLALVLAAMVPDVVARLEALPPLTPHAVRLEPGPATSPTAAGDELTRTVLTPTSRTLVVGTPTVEWLAALSAQSLKKNQQVLVLVPELGPGQRLCQQLSARLGAVVFPFPDRSQRMALWRTWIAGLEGRPMVLVGTRRAVFAPLDQLGLIVLLDEANPSFKQWDQNPRYHAREVAVALANLSQARFLAASPAPSVPLFWSAREKKFSLLRIPPPATPTVSLIDLKQEQAAGNFGFVSGMAGEALQRTAGAAGLRAIVVVNRRGTAALVRCDECGFAPCCSRCQLPFAYHAPNADRDQPGENLAAAADLRCHRCGQTGLLPPVCPRCHSVRLRPRGLGVQRACTVVKKLVAADRVRRFDGDYSPRQRLEVIRSIQLGQVQVVVTTRAGLTALAPFPSPLVVVLSADTALQQPNYRAAERVYHMLVGFQQLATNQMLVETYHPMHPVYQAVSRGEPEVFYQAELSARREFHYPPFGRLVRLVYRHATAGGAEREARRVKQRLQDASATISPDVAVHGPVRVLRSARTYAWQILLKFSYPADGTAYPPPPWGQSVASGHHIFDLIPDDWVIDVDPEEV